MQILRPVPRPTKSEALGMGPSNQSFNKPSDSDACCSWETLLLNILKWLPCPNTFESCYKFISHWKTAEFISKLKAKHSVVGRLINLAFLFPNIIWTQKPQRSRCYLAILEWIMTNWLGSSSETLVEVVCTTHRPGAPIPFTEDLPCFFSLWPVPWAVLEATCWRSYYLCKSGSSNDSGDPVPSPEWNWLELFEWEMHFYYVWAVSGKISIYNSTYLGDVRLTAVFHYH